MHAEQWPASAGATWDQPLMPLCGGAARTHREGGTCDLDSEDSTHTASRVPGVGSAGCGPEFSTSTAGSFRVDNCVWHANGVINTHMAPSRVQGEWRSPRGWSCVCVDSSPRDAPLARVLRRPHSRAPSRLLADKPEPGGVYRSH